MREHAGDGGPSACSVQEPGVPGCDTGPLGRLRFVIDELRAAWRRHRDRPAGDGETKE